MRRHRAGARLVDNVSAAQAPNARSGDAWYGEFFANESLIGAPVATRDEPWIGFDWGRFSTTAGGPVDRLSARWTCSVHGGRDHYRFCAMGDDGGRSWMDDHLALDGWHPNNEVAYCGTKYVYRGSHDVKVAYHEHGDEALIDVWWEPE